MLTLSLSPSSALSQAVTCLALLRGQCPFSLLSRPVFRKQKSSIFPLLCHRDLLLSVCGKQPSGTKAVDRMCACVEDSRVGVGGWGVAWVGVRARGDSSVSTEPALTTALLVWQVLWPGIFHPGTWLTSYLNRTARFQWL